MKGKLLDELSTGELAIDVIRIIVSIVVDVITKSVDLSINIMKGNNDEKD